MVIIMIIKKLYFRNKWDLAFGLPSGLRSICVFVVGREF